MAELEIGAGYGRDKAERVAMAERGVKAAKKAIELNANGKEGHYFYAINLGSKVEVKGALTQLPSVRVIKKENERALEIDPNYGPAILVKARFLSDMPGLFGGDDAQAEALFLRAIETAPRFEAAYISYAEFLVKKKRPGDALAVIDKVLAPEFDHPYPSTWADYERLQALTLRETARSASQ
ncbi:TRAP transporter TatT component family protein [bacterium]|nr:TRAP transporter TatT component family protein [bacterium]